MASSISGDHDQEDLQSIQRQIHEQKTRILESIRRMHGYINESEVVGIDATAELVAQREKLENIEKRLDCIDVKLVNAQKNVNKLGSIFGEIKNYFSPPKSAFPKSISQPQISDKKKKKTNPATDTDPTNQATDPTDDADTYLGKLRSDMDDIERESEDLLSDMEQGLRRLKMLAMDMNNELEGQKPLTERLTKKVDLLNENVVKKKEDTGEILLRSK